MIRKLYYGNIGEKIASIFNTKKNVGFDFILFKTMNILRQTFSLTLCNSLEGKSCLFFSQKKYRMYTNIISVFCPDVVVAACDSRSKKRGTETCTCTTCNILFDTIGGPCEVGTNRIFLPPYVIGEFPENKYLWHMGCRLALAHPDRTNILSAFPKEVKHNCLRETAKLLFTFKEIYFFKFGLALYENGFLAYHIMASKDAYWRGEGGEGGGVHVLIRWTFCS